MSVCSSVTVGEYLDIKQYHSVLCALSQGTLCTFLQGWGDEGEADGCGEALYDSSLSVADPHCRLLGEKLGKT